MQVRALPVGSAEARLPSAEQPESLLPLKHIIARYERNCHGADWRRARRTCGSPAADLYSIIKTTEKLERAFVRDAIDAAQYEEACGRLIGQFKVLWSSMKDTVSSLCCAPPFCILRRFLRRAQQPANPWRSACTSSGRL
jgi:hypothetical protein